MRCRDATEANEYVIPSDSWSGYFKGVKAAYAFLETPDGINGGLGFMVLRVYDRKPLFQDTAQHGLQSIRNARGKWGFFLKRVFRGSGRGGGGGRGFRGAPPKKGGGGPGGR